MTDYNTWYIRADQAWTMVADLEDEQGELVDADFGEVARSEELQMEIKEWREAAEYAEKKMAELEKCMGRKCKPALDLNIPFKPWMNVGVQMDDGSIQPLT